MGLPRPRPDGTALITGASSGIGADIARELAARGHGLTLVARREPRLRELAEELAGAHGIRVEVVAVDLTDPEARAVLPDRTQQLGLEVDVLVNNAGFGTSGRLEDLSPEEEIAQVRILVEAPIDLAARFAGAMVRRGQGAILNVASFAGFQPVPYASTYGASKAALLSFSEATHAELRPRGVTVTALCPGPVPTEFFEVSAQNPIERAMPKFSWVESRDVARAGVDGLAAGKRVVVPRLTARATSLTMQHVPRMLAVRFSERLFR
jgi:short-subunit dehydrogenase